MMQDIDRILAKIARHAAVAGLDLESVREVLFANMLAEQPLPIDFHGKPPPEPKVAAVRVIAEWTCAVPSYIAIDAKSRYWR